MIQQPESPRNLEGSRAAMIRAARRAAELAKRHNQPLLHQPLLLWREGRLVRVMPDDLPSLPEEAPWKVAGV